MADPQGVCLALNETSFGTVSPVWTRLDSEPNLISSYTVRRGRSFEVDEMQTGTCQIAAADSQGLLDPTNTFGAYYGLIEPRIQGAVAIHNPVTGNWRTIFRGFVEDLDYEPHIAQTVTRPTISMSDAFMIFAGIEMVPGAFGDPLPTGSSSDVFFEETVGTADDRINQILTNAHWPLGLDLREIFSANVRLMDTVYSAGETVLAALQDCADAEFPGVANHYMSASGVYTFHGRLARFDYTNPDYGIHVWNAGDGDAVAAAPTTTAQIRAMKYNRGLARIINAAMATPQDNGRLTRAQRAAQVVTDAASITRFGVCSWSALDLLTWHGTLTGNDWLDETKLFASYYVANYKNPRTRINQLTFRSLAPDDPRAPYLWNLICNVELNDVVNVTVALPGGGGFTAEPYFVEGISYEVNPARPEFADVTLTLDLSPQAYFSDPAGLTGT